MSNNFVLDITSDLTIEVSTVSALCELTDSPRALTVYLLMKNGEYGQLVDLEVNPHDYVDSESFRKDYLVTEALQKSPSLPLKVDRERKAISAFFEAEELCKTTNDRLLRDKGPEMGLLKKARSIIDRVLGPLDRKTLQEIEANFGFGPGATTAIRGSGCVLSDKYDEEIHLTTELIPFFRAMLGDRWWEKSRNPVIVEGNRFTTVPKNAKTDRGICIEPSLNIYGQKGIGAVLRRRLRKLGVDLSNQKINQRLARLAGKRDLATIDLSMASDTLSWATVYTLLPADWFELLDTFRCSHTLVDEEYVELEKFSSMGNGFTFELESLIFAALTLACDPSMTAAEDWHVYGDDIILPTRYSQQLIDALAHLGFKVNTKKSFLAGNFFESCGTDWFGCQPVRPFYLRGSKDKIPYVLQIANSLRLYARSIREGEYCDAEYQSLWAALVKRIPTDWSKHRVPLELGDVGVIDLPSSTTRRCSIKNERGWDAWSVSYIRMKPVERRKRSFGRLLVALACIGNEIETRGREPKRGYLGKPMPGKTTVQQWSSGLHWM